MKAAPAGRTPGKSVGRCHSCAHPDTGNDRAHRASSDPWLRYRRHDSAGLAHLASVAHAKSERVLAPTTSPLPPRRKTCPL